MDFPPISKAAWLARIEKDLKDKPLDALFWQVEAGISADPFAHADDFGSPPPPLSPTPENWEINENINCQDPAAANAQALEALGFGAESLRFDFEKSPDSASLGQIFDKIHPDFISIHFSGNAASQEPGTFFYLLSNLANQRGTRPENLRGSLDFAPADWPGIQDWRYLAELLDLAEASFPDFKIISVKGSTGEQTATGQLASLLKTANLYFEKLEERGIPPEKTAALMRFHVQIGKSYFLEIAKLRALKLLWFNLLRGWNAKILSPEIDVQFSPTAYGDDLYTNMVRGTTMAMSAVLGGAKTLTVLPYDEGREPEAKYSKPFSRRIARNVQHLLKMESHLGEVADPAAGSFFIEKLTLQLAETAWQKAFGNQ